MIADKQQRGMTTLGLIFVLAVFGFAGYVGLKLFPIYTESFKIDSAMKGVVDDPDVANMSKSDILASFIRRLDVNDVDRITARNYRQYLDIEKDQDTVSLDVAYRAQAPLFANVSLVIDFHKHAQN